MEVKLPAQIKKILKNSAFDELIGSLESDEIDFKLAPYPLETEFQKYSFLEDVTALANSRGGIIVIGCRTESAPVEGDLVTEISTVARQSLGFERYRSILNQNVHPQLKNVHFLWFATSDDPMKGLAAIEVVPASAADRPHLISHVVSSDTGRRSTTKYALVTRTGARNDTFPVQTIHGLIKIGSAVGDLNSRIDEIQSRLTGLEALLTDRGKQDTKVPLKLNRSAFLKDCPTIMGQTGFEDHATLVLAAYPSDTIELRGIYDSETRVAKAFDNPPSLRRGGFDFEMLDARAEIVAGNARRRFIRSYKATQLSISGRLFALFRADQNFLAWFQGGSESQPMRYRAYVLAEVTYLFAAYLRSISDASDARPDYYDLMIALRNSYVGGVAPQLGVARDHSPSSWSFTQPRSAPKPNLLKVVRIPSSMPIARVAFELRAALYHRFGFPDDQMPYSTITEQGRVTEANDITNPNRQ